MMKMTITEANRYVQQLKDEVSRIKEAEAETRTYEHTEGEAAYPQKYDFVDTQRQLGELNRKILMVRHAISVFNVQTIVPAFDMTIDSALVYIAMLSEQKKKLDEMKRMQPISRKNNYHNIQIVHRNFDQKEVQDESEKVVLKLNKLRAALDLVNLTSTIEVDT